MRPPLIDLKQRRPDWWRNAVTRHILNDKRASFDERLSRINKLMDELKGKT